MSPGHLDKQVFQVQGIDLEAGAGAQLFVFLGAQARQHGDAAVGVAVAAHFALQAQRVDGAGVARDARRAFQQLVERTLQGDLAVLQEGDIERHPFQVGQDVGGKDHRGIALDHVVYQLVQEVAPLK